jgi:hypothetical protein
LIRKDLPFRFLDLFVILITAAGQERARPEESLTKTMHVTPAVDEDDLSNCGATVQSAPDVDITVVTSDPEDISAVCGDRQVTVVAI